MTQRGYRCFDCANAPLNMTKWVAREGSGGVVKSSVGVVEWSWLHHDEKIKANFRSEPQ